MSRRTTLYQYGRILTDMERGDLAIAALEGAYSTRDINIAIRAIKRNQLTLYKRGTKLHDAILASGEAKGDGNG